MLEDNMKEFGGLPVLDFDTNLDTLEASKIAYRIRIETWDSSAADFAELLGNFVERPDVSEVTALIIGPWGELSSDDSSGVVSALASVAERLPNLRALFLGEIGQDDSEISWIQQSDVSPLFEAFPALEELRIRGGNGLVLGRPSHERLRILRIESGGLDGDVLRSLAAANLPALEHLELWLGDEGYGNSCTPADVEALLAGEKFPRLRYLGLRDDCRADSTAQVVAGSSVLARIETLDLSLGTLGDEGAEALLASGKLGSLKKLDIHHHFVSDPVIERLKAACAELDASEGQEADRWDGREVRYVAVGE